LNEWGITLFLTNENPRLRSVLEAPRGICGAGDRRVTGGRRGYYDFDDNFFEEDAYVASERDPCDEFTHDEFSDEIGDNEKSLNDFNCARDQQAHHCAFFAREENYKKFEEAWAAGDRLRPRAPDTGGIDSRTLSERRAFRQLGQHDAGGDAALPGRSGLAEQNDTRFASLD
jgi:hypothetical protein